MRRLDLLGKGSIQRRRREVGEVLSTSQADTTEESIDTINVSSVVLIPSYRPCCSAGEIGLFEFHFDRVEPQSLKLGVLGCAAE